jgi:hypothetical protein
MKYPTGRILNRVKKSLLLEEQNVSCYIQFPFRNQVEKHIFRITVYAMWVAICAQFTILDDSHEDYALRCWNCSYLLTRFWMISIRLIPVYMSRLYLWITPCPLSHYSKLGGILVIQWYELRRNDATALSCYSLYLCCFNEYSIYHI